MRSHVTTRSAPRWLAACALGAVVLLVAGCSGSDDPAGADDATPDDAGSAEPLAATRAGPPSQERAAVPTVTGPITSGAGAAVLLPPGFDLTTVGYVEQEFFLSGTASSYTSDEELSDDGRWEVRTDRTAPYTTRIVVRRPSDDAAFDGTVVVEWLNVSGGLDASPDWSYTHNEIIRSGSAWVGVSAQEVGIEGGGNPMGAALALKVADAERYAPLEHPGDEFSYDMFTQAGAAVWFAADQVLGGTTPELVLAAGESQSAFRLTTYVDAVAPLTDMFDGYLVHSRAAFGAPLSDSVEAPAITRSRTDLEVPVLVLSSETDVVGERLGYARARQPDTQWFAGWEMAGTSHADAYNLGIADSDDGSGAGDDLLFAAMSDPPSSVYFDVITCDRPINAGPHTYIARAALASLVTWARTGQAPPSMPRLELDETGDDVIRGPQGTATTGIRSPQLDVPIATLSGVGQPDGSFCVLFGTTEPTTPEQLTTIYANHATFVDEWIGAVDAAVAAGALLDADAAQLRRVAEESAIGG